MNFVTLYQTCRAIDRRKIPKTHEFRVYENGDIEVRVSETDWSNDHRLKAVDQQSLRDAAAMIRQQQVPSNDETMTNNPQDKSTTTPSSNQGEGQLLQAKRTALADAKAAAARATEVAVAAEAAARAAVEAAEKAEAAAKEAEQAVTALEEEVRELEKKEIALIENELSQTVKQTKEAEERKAKAGKQETEANERKAKADERIKVANTRLNVLKKIKKSFNLKG